MKRHKQKSPRPGSSGWQVLTILLLGICLTAFLVLLSKSAGGVKAERLMDIPIRSQLKANYSVDAIRKFMPSLKIELIRQVITTRQGPSFIIESEFKNIVGGLGAVVPSVTPVLAAGQSTQRPALLASTAPSATASPRPTNTRTATLTATPTATRPSLNLATATSDQPPEKKTSRPKATTTQPPAPTNTPPPASTNTLPANTPAHQTLEPTSTSTLRPDNKPTQKPKVTKTPKVKDRDTLTVEDQIIGMFRLLSNSYLQVFNISE